MPRNKDDDPHVAILRSKLDASQERIRMLEVENERLSQRLSNLNLQVATLRAQAAERKSALWKSIPHDKQTTIQKNAVEEHLVVVDKSPSMVEILDAASKNRGSRVPKPPPKPSSAASPVTPSGKGVPPPPPPPPPHNKLKCLRSDVVRRAPEVVELYRALTRIDSKLSRTGTSGTPVITNPREMMEEIQNRSAHLLAIKSDVETQGEFIKLLAKEIQNAVFRDITDVEAFVKWLDEELSYLVDERAVLKHFPQWPEKKADAMREAAFGYRDLRNLDTEVTSFHDDPHQQTSTTLKRMQVLQDKLERSVHALERARETAIKKYREFHIPWEWMLDNGMVAKLKAGSIKLAKKYMQRIVVAMQSHAVLEKEEMIFQGVRFAFRVHQVASPHRHPPALTNAFHLTDCDRKSQFVGGLDAESRHVFQELKMASTCHWQSSNQRHTLSNALPN